MNVKQAEPLGSAFLFLIKWMTELIVEQHFIDNLQKQKRQSQN